MSKVKKSRYWGFIAYPESLPSDWINTLTLTGLPIAISPLHDSDFNADDTQKKPHYHVMMCFDGPTTQNVVNDISFSVNGTNCVAVNSIRGMFRYHCHLDNPEKTQYDEKDRILLNGFNIFDYAQLTSSEYDEITRLVIGYIHSANIFEYCDLVDFCKENDLQAFGFVITHTLFFNTYINSLRNKMIKYARYQAEKREKDV